MKSDSTDRTYLQPQDASGKGVWVAMPTPTHDKAVIALQEEIATLRENIGELLRVRQENVLQEQTSILQETFVWWEKENKRQDDEIAALRKDVNLIGRKLATG